MNNLAEESPSIMKVCHSNQLLKMPSGAKPIVTQVKHLAPKSINKSLYKNCSQDLNYALSNYKNVIPPTRGLLKNLS